MKRILFVSFFAVLPVAAQAAPLAVVDVGAPAINCLFTTASPCTITVSDSVGSIPVIGGRLQSRTYAGARGSAASGLTAYEYRVDLTNAVGITAIDCIDWLKVKFGPVASLDFNGDKKPDQVFVVTSGGLGTIGLASAVQSAGTITFKFKEPVCQGRAPRRGVSSFFFGVVAKKPPQPVKATVHTTLTGSTHSVAARSAP